MRVELPGGGSCLPWSCSAVVWWSRRTHLFLAFLPFLGGWKERKGSFSCVKAQFYFCYFFFSVMPAVLLPKWFFHLNHFSSVLWCAADPAMSQICLKTRAWIHCSLVRCGELIWFGAKSNVRILPEMQHLSPTQLWPKAARSAAFPRFTWYFKFTFCKGKQEAPT